MIIAISGKSQSGKGITASLIKELYPSYNWETRKLMDHPSETSLDNFKDFDVIIHNNGTIEDLKNNLKKFLDSKLIS